MPPPTRRFPVDVDQSLTVCGYFCFLEITVFVGRTTSKALLGLRVDLVILGTRIYTYQFYLYHKLMLWSHYFYFDSQLFPAGDLPDIFQSLEHKSFSTF